VQRFVHSRRASALCHKVQPGSQFAILSDLQHHAHRRLFSIAKHLSGRQHLTYPDDPPLNLHLLKSVTVYNAIELWSTLNELEMRPASLFGTKMIIVDGFSGILASSMYFDDCPFTILVFTVTFFDCRGGKRIKSGHAIVENITAALKRLSATHEIACLVTNHMCVYSCPPLIFAYRRHPHLSIQCVLSKILSPDFRIFLVGLMCNIARSCISECGTRAYTAVRQKI